MFKIGDRVKFKKSSIDTGMIDATEGDVFTVRESYKRTVTLKELQGCYHVTHFEHVKEEPVNNTEEKEIKWEGSQIDWQVGQEVWDTSLGQGEVTHVFDTQVQVKFGNRQYWNIVWYTPEGIYQTFKCAKNRTLFFSEPIVTAELFPPKKPFVPKLKEGDKVFIRTKSGIYPEGVVREVFSEVEDRVYISDDWHYYMKYDIESIHILGEEVKFQ